jgi:hypothetical protein
MKNKKIFTDPHIASSADEFTENGPWIEKKKQ